MARQNLLNKVKGYYGAFKSLITTSSITTNTVFNRVVDIFDIVFGKRSAKIFIQKGYGDNYIVFSIVNKIAKVSAKIKRTISASSAVKELFENPNPDQNRMLFDMELSTYLNVTGEAFARLIKGFGAGNEWVIMHPDDVEVEVDSNGKITKFIETLGNKTPVKYEPEEVMHIPYPNIVHTTDLKRRARGYSPLESGWAVVKASNEILKAEASILEKRGTIGILSNESGETMLPKERKKAQEEFNKDSGGADKFNSVYITNQKMRFQAMGMSPTDLKLLESQNEKRRAISTMYELSSVLFNDPENTTYNNVQNANVAAYDDVYIPHSEFIDLHKEMFLSKAFNETVKIERDTSDIKILQMVGTEDGSTAVRNNT